MRGIYSALTIANNFIDLGNKHRTACDHLKLQKMVYFTHGGYLAWKNKPLIHEYIRAHKYGIVIQELYNALKSHGGKFIKQHIPNTNPPLVKQEDKDIHQLITKAWDAYGQYPSNYLAELVHYEGTPWYFTYLAHKNNHLNRMVANL